MPSLNVKKQDHEQISGFYVSLGETKKEKGTTHQKSDVLVINDDLTSDTNSPTISSEALELNDTNTA